MRKARPRPPPSPFTRPLSTAAQSRAPYCHLCGGLLFAHKLRVDKLFPSRRPARSRSKAVATAASRAVALSDEDSQTAGKVVAASMVQLPGRPMIVQCAYISFCACFGTLARLYTDDIRSHEVALQGSILSNAVGSFALGAIQASELSQERQGALYAGLTVGLCGSYTTFSGWQLRYARAALGDAPGPTGGVNAVAYIVQSLAFFAVSFVAGRDLIKTLAEKGRPWRGRDARDVTAERAIGGMGCVYGILAVLLAVDDDRTRRIHWLACMFAPVGALSRFFLSRKLNKRWRDGAIPAGTFTANILGSVAMAFVYYGATASDLAGWSGVVLGAFRAGFLGSLTTMSTFMSEVVNHRDEHGRVWGYAYLAVTTIVAVVLSIVVGAALGD